MSQAPSPEHAARLTISSIARLFAEGERIAMLTAYDYPTARILDEAGIPMLLVGDSVGQVMLGYDSTVRVTMAEMLHHTKAVVRGTKHALVVTDMPFLSYGVTPEASLENAGVMMREGGAGAVKLEGGERSARTIESIVRAGIPVMGHIGLTPQSIHQLGGHRVQGKTRAAGRQQRVRAHGIERWRGGCTAARGGVAELAAFVGALPQPVQPLAQVPAGVIPSCLLRTGQHLHLPRGDRGVGGIFDRDNVAPAAGRLLAGADKRDGLFKRGFQIGSALLVIGCQQRPCDQRVVVHAS